MRIDESRRDHLARVAKAKSNARLLNRKRTVFYPIANRLAAFSKKDKQQILQEPDREFIATINEILDAPDAIFPHVASPDGLSPSELEILKRIRNLDGPASPNISPFNLDKVASNVPSDNEIERRYWKLMGLGEPNISPLDLGKERTALITTQELDQRHLDLVGPTLAGQPITWVGW